MKPSSILTFSRTSHSALIHRIVTDPDIYPYISDDNAPPPENYAIPDPELVWYVLVTNSSTGSILGLFAFIPQNSICFEMHTCLFPWGRHAVEAMREVFQWMWANSPCLRIIGNAPASNPAIRKAAMRAGMIEYGINPTSFLKGGVLQDQFLLGVSKS